jgi:hypothetical protein
MATLTKQRAFGWYIGSDDYHTFDTTIQVKNKDVFAEVAMTRVVAPVHVGAIAIVQIVSDSGVENFEEGRQALFRRNVTSITTALWVWDAYIRGRLILNYWS